MRESIFSLCPPPPTRPQHSLFVPFETGGTRALDCRPCDLLSPLLSAHYQSCVLPLPPSLASFPSQLPTWPTRRGITLSDFTTDHDNLKSGHSKIHAATKQNKIVLGVSVSLQVSEKVYLACGSVFCVSRASSMSRCENK